jgi:hypothetical protein
VVRRRLPTSRRRATPWRRRRGPAAGTTSRTETGRRTRPALTGFGRARQGKERQRAMNRVMALNLIWSRDAAVTERAKAAIVRAPGRTTSRRPGWIHVPRAGCHLHHQDAQAHPVGDRRRRRWRPLPPTLRQQERRRPARCRRRSLLPRVRPCRLRASAEAVRVADRSSAVWREARRSRVSEAPRDPRSYGATSSGRTASATGRPLARLVRRSR